MASTFSDLKIELIGTGEQAGTWGNTTNINLGTALQEAITGSADVAFSSGDVTLTLTNSNGAQVGRNLRLNLTGTSGGARELILGSGMQVEKFYLINNGLADTVTVKNTTGTGVDVPAGKSTFVFNNGTNVVDAINFITGITTGTINATTFDTNVAAAGATLAGTTLAADGTDTDISLTMTPKGAGELVTTKFMSGVFSDKLSALGNLGATATLTNSNGTVFTATLDQSCTLTIAGSNQVANRSSSFTLILTRGAGGPFTLTLAGGTFLAADGDLAPTTTDGSTDIWFFFTTNGGTNWYVSIPIKNAQSI